MSESIEVVGIDRAAGEGRIVVALVKIEDGKARVVEHRPVEEGESFLAAAGRMYEEEESVPIRGDLADPGDESSAPRVLVRLLFDGREELAWFVRAPARGDLVLFRALLLRASAGVALRAEGGVDATAWCEVVSGRVVPG